MALIGNHSVLNKTAATLRHGTATAGAYAANTRSNYDKAGAQRNIFISFEKFTSVPNGYSPPYAMTIAQKSGGMASYTTAKELIAATANLAGGRNLEGSAALTIVDNSPVLDQIVSGAGSASLTMAKSDAALVAAAQGVASAACTITPNADCGAIFSVTASSACSASADCDISALAFMEAEAGGPTELSPEGLAQAVWNAVASDFNDAGSMGEKLNDAGGAGNPWASLVADNQDAGSFGEAITDIQAEVDKRLKTTTFFGAK